MTTNAPYVYEYAYPVPLSGSIEHVFHALTDAEALSQWFAEQVHIEGKVGGKFCFWGKYTFGTPGSSDATQILTEISPPTQLSFSWHLMNRDTQVSWTLVEKPNDTGTTVKITVRQEFESLPEGARADAMIDDLWRIHTGNLYAYLQGDSVVYRPDFSDPNPVVNCEQIINAPPAIVFAVLTEPDYIKQWFPAPAPTVDPRVGGDYGFGFSFDIDGETITPPPMKILAYEPNVKLAISWPDWRMDPNVPDQTVTWLLEDLGGKTRLTLQHSGFTRATDVSDYPFGWQEFIRKIDQIACLHQCTVR